MLYYTDLFSFLFFLILLFFSILFYSILCYTMLCYAILSYPMLCYALLYYAILCYATCYTILYYAMLYYTMLSNAMLCCPVLYWCYTGGRVYTCFIDLKKVFDSIWHNGLLYSYIGCSKIISVAAFMLLLKIFIPNVTASSNWAQTKQNLFSIHEE